MATIIALLSILGPILVAYLHWREANEPVKLKEERDEEVQQGRIDIVNSNADAISMRIDKACSSSNTSVLGDDEDTARRLKAVTGL